MANFRVYVNDKDNPVVVQVGPNTLVSDIACQLEDDYPINVGYPEVTANGMMVLGIEKVDKSLTYNFSKFS